jgi:glycosyltransferase involved in cell wall biosynthesis
MDLPRSSRKYYRKYFPRFARRADRITTVSEYSKRDIAESYGIAPDKIDVVYNGVNEIYSALSPAEVAIQRDKLTGGNPYFVFVGSMHPRKNLSTLLKAFDRFRSGSDNAYKMVIVGEKMFMTGDIKRTFAGMKHGEDVVFTGRLSPQRLHEVVGASAGMTFIPLFEGFGIPLLEAMKCEVPILASNVTSLPEVAAEAAIYADPLNVEEIAEGMSRLATDQQLSSRLVSEGRKRVGEFSWDKTADRLWDSIIRVLD